MARFVFVVSRWSSSTCGPAAGPGAQVLEGEALMKIARKKTSQPVAS